MQKCAGVIARAHYVINLSLDDISLLAVETKLVAALIILAVAPIHRVVTVRRGMVERIILFEIAAEDVRADARPRSPHPRLPVGVPDLPMAAGARRRIYVPGIGTGDEEALRHGRPVRRM